AAEQIIFTIAKRMVHQGAGMLHRGFGRAYQMEHRQMLGIGAGDARKCCKLADAIGGADGRGPPDAGIAVRGVGGVELVTAADPAHLRVLADGVVHRKGEIPGNTEDIADANLLEALQDILNDGNGHGGSSGYFILKSFSTNPARPSMRSPTCTLRPSGSRI